MKKTPSTVGSIKINKTPKNKADISTPVSKRKVDLSIILEEKNEINTNPTVLDSLNDKREPLESYKTLPVKKRKIEHENADPNSTHVLKKKKWVDFCTLQHKQDILDNQYLCSDVIISAQNLLQIQFPNINGFQETILASVFSNGKWTSTYRISSTGPPMRSDTP